MSTPVRPDFRGVVHDNEQMRIELNVLARALPVGTRIRHRSGRIGTVVLDQPPHVPGLFDGRPTAWCFAIDRHYEALVCASWENDRGFDRWICWTSMEAVQKVSGGTRVNRPAVKAGAR
ncbi:hypothetical protein ACWGI0_00295 [Streptomyces sp. NPDC054802]